MSTPHQPSPESVPTPSPEAMRAAAIRQNPWGPEAIEAERAHFDNSVVGRVGRHIGRYVDGLLDKADVKVSIGRAKDDPKDRW